MISDRTDAGRQLAARLKQYINEKPIILCIPRGGVVVGREIAEVLKAPLDIVVPRKIGLPTNPEIAVGAVAQDGTIFLDDYLMAVYGLTVEALEEIIQDEKQEILRRAQNYRDNNLPLEVEGRTCILVDDGVATGYTILAAVRLLKKSNPHRLILAVPVAPGEVLEKFKPEFDEIVCLIEPEEFSAVGQFYGDFGQTTDEEVKKILQEFKS